MSLDRHGALADHCLRLLPSGPIGSCTGIMTRRLLIFHVGPLGTTVLVLAEISGWWRLGNACLKPGFGFINVFVMREYSYLT